MLDDGVLQFASNDAQFHKTENAASGNPRHVQFCKQDLADILRRYTHFYDQLLGSLFGVFCLEVFHYDV